MRPFSIDRRGLASCPLLAWRPGERAAAEKVNVEMLDALAAVGAGVDDGAIAFGEALLAGDFRGRAEQVADERLLFGGDLVEGVEVLAGHDENMHGSLRIDVGEGVAEVVFVNGLGGNFTLEDFAE
jgi:hypothetical protein